MTGNELKFSKLRADRTDALWLKRQPVIWRAQKTHWDAHLLYPFGEIFNKFWRPTIWWQVSPEKFWLGVLHSNCLCFMRPSNWIIFAFLVPIKMAEKFGTSFTWGGYFRAARVQRLINFACFNCKTSGIRVVLPGWLVEEGDNVRFSVWINESATQNKRFCVWFRLKLVGAVFHTAESAVNLKETVSWALI
jgi:hypothetical protein